MFKILATCALAAVLHSPQLAAQTSAYPNRPVRVIVPYGPGTAPDLVGRVISEQLTKRTGQPFVVENRVGAGGKIGTEAAAGATPDGYTLLLGGKDTHGILTHLYPSWSVHPERDFAPIALLARIQNVVVANLKVPASTPQELIALAKDKELRYGTPGVGTNLHLLAEALKNAYGLKLQHIPYSRSFAEAMPALVRGDLDLVVAGLPPAMPLLKDGRIKAIAVTGTQRSRFAPDVPTFQEAGIPDMQTGGWFALFAPAGTPAAVVDRLADEIRASSKVPEVVIKLEGIYADAVASTPAELQRLVVEETARWGKVIEKNQIKVE